jgi:hypothetical protein
MKEGLNLLKNFLVNEEVAISLASEDLKGDILDVGLDNYGVIYNLCKNASESISVEYLDKGTLDKAELEEQRDIYDTAVFFFTLGKIYSLKNRKKILRDVSNYLKEDGEVIIWDIDKTKLKAVNLKLKIMMPDRVIKKITIKDYNMMNDTSQEKVFKLLKPIYDIVGLKSYNNIYCIRARKKVNKIDESVIDRD